MILINLKEFLAAHPLIGFGASFGTGAGSYIASLFVAINPFLQFLGLCVGLYIGYLTIEAKHAEKRERRNRVHPDLTEALRKKAERTQNGQITHDYEKDME